MGQPIKQFFHWYMGKSMVSKLYFTLSLTIFILMYFNFLVIEDIYLTIETLERFQIWRLVTCITYEHAWSLLSFPFKFYLSYTILVNFEERIFGRDNYKKYAEFLWLMLVVWVIVVGVTLLGQFYVANHFFFLCLSCIWSQKHPNSSVELALSITLPVKYLPYMYGIYYWMLSIVGFWVHVGVAFGLGYAYYYLKIYAMSHYGKDYFPTPGLFQRLVEKYLIVEQSIGLVRVSLEEQEDDEDPYGQYGYYKNEGANQRQQRMEMREQDEREEDS